jgi:hypothetical protein
MRLHLFLTHAFEQARLAHQAILNVSATRGGRRLRLLRRHLQSAGKTLQEAVQQRREKTASLDS